MTFQAIPTNIGREWNARRFLGQNVSPITFMAFGDGDRFPSGGEVSLENEVHVADLSNAGLLEDGTAAFFDAPLPDGVGGFVIREVGLFTQDGLLVAIGRRETPLPLAEADDLTYRFEIFFEHLEAIAVTVNPVHGITGERRIDTASGLSGGGALSANREIVTDWSNLVVSKPIASSHILNMRQGVNQSKVTNGSFADWLVNETSRETRTDDKRLARFNQLWINETVTYSVGEAPETDFKNLGEGMEFLKNRLIRDSATVTFSLIAGVHTYNGDVNITHPSSRNINFIGANLIGSSPVKSDFTITGNTAAARASDGTANLAMLRSKFATEVRINGGSFVGFTGSGLIDNILFVGDGSPNFGLSLTDGVYNLGNISIHGFGKSNLFAINSRLIHSGNISATASGQTGINYNASYASPGQVSKTIISYGNEGDGVEFNFETVVSDLSTHTDGNAILGLSVARNSSFHATTTVASDSRGNGVHGAQAFFATIDASGFVAQSNGSIGLVASAGGKVIAPSCTVTGNGAVGVFASDASYIQATLSNVSANPTNYSPAPNAAGNFNSYVRT